MTGNCHTQAGITMTPDMTFFKFASATRRAAGPARQRPLAGTVTRRLEPPGYGQRGTVETRVTVLVTVSKASESLAFKLLSGLAAPRPALPGRDQLELAPALAAA